jgi:hypothetical protein
MLYRNSHGYVTNHTTSLLPQPRKLLHFQNFHSSSHFIMLGLQLGLQVAQPADWKMIIKNLDDVLPHVFFVGVRWTKNWAELESLMTKKKLQGFLLQLDVLVSSVPASFTLTSIESHTICTMAGLSAVVLQQKMRRVKQNTPTLKSCNDFVGGWFLLTWVHYYLPSHRSMSHVLN